MTTHCSLEGIIRVSHDSGLPRPHIGIVGNLHGNEPCGLEVVRALMSPTHPIRRRLRRGTLVLIQGNPEAGRKGQRHTENGVDLNRQFDFAFLSEVPPTEWTYEHHRALTLAPIVESLDALLDLHSSTRASSPFVISPRNGLPLARRLGCPYVTVGWDHPDVLTLRFMNSLLWRNGLPALAVECGQHEDPGTFAFAFDVTERFLGALGMLEGTVAEQLSHSMTLEVLKRVRKPEASFRFSRPFRGFDTVSQGELIGSGRSSILYAEQAGYILLPNEGVEVGEDLFFMGRSLEVYPSVLRHPTRASSQVRPSPC